MNYRITQAAQNNLKRIEGMVMEMDRKMAVNNKTIADLEQENQMLLEVKAIILEYAGAVKADGMR